MSHIRDAMPHGSKHCACPRQLQGPFLTEQLPQELQCQFVLKPSQVAACQQLNGTLSSHPSIPPHSRATSLALLQKADVPGWGCSGGHTGACRCVFQLLGGVGSVAPPDLSVLLYTCHLRKLHFDKLPVK